SAPSAARGERGRGGAELTDGIVTVRRLALPTPLRTPPPAATRRSSAGRRRSRRATPNGTRAPGSARRVAAGRTVGARREEGRLRRGRAPARLRHRRGAVRTP